MTLRLPLPSGVYAYDAGQRPAGTVPNRSDRLLSMADVREEELQTGHLPQLEARVQRVSDDVHHTEGGCHVRDWTVCVCVTVRLR